MSERSAKVLFDGMLESIDAILNYTVHMDYEKFNKDRKTRDAVLMQLNVLGETANRVPAELKKILPEIEWGRLPNNLADHNDLSSRSEEFDTKQKGGF